MGSVLFLCHRLPWPPNKGDKIRSYHVLRRLLEKYRVYLGTFVDDPADWQHVEQVQALCADTCIRPLPPWRMRWRALRSLARGEALSLGAYRDAAMRRWVDHLTTTRRLDLALCYSSAMAPFVMHHAQLPRVMDFVDADSDKWRQYAQSSRGLTRAIYRRESKRLAAFECKTATRFDASLFVSEAEAAFFRQQTPAAADRVYGVANGVDCGYWDPDRTCANPYRRGERVLTFAGAMDYRANVDAVRWFAAAVWPQIRERRRDARFYIVGSHPAPAVQELDGHDGIVVTGRVDDVRPYVQHAHASVAPLRIARGIQNKVLEALAMEKVVLATPAAWEGIEDFNGHPGCIRDAPEALAGEALRWLDHAQPQRVPAARAHVLLRYDWGRRLDAYENVLREAQRTATGRSETAHSVRVEAVS